MDATETPLESFEAKWTAAHPEFALALRFESEAERAARSAFACLVFEIEHAAFGIREMQPAAVKLQWWAEEFVRTGRGEARHPLTQALSDRIGRAAIPNGQWQAAIVGALAQRDPEPAADTDALLDAYLQLYAPIGAIEAALFETDEAAVARSLALVRALRETAALPVALRDGKLPLPLDVLARHRLARGNLSEASPARRDALGEWFRMLSEAISELAALKRLGVLRAGMVSADGARAKRAAGASEPLAALSSALGTLSLPVLWSAWRAARRSRR